MGKKKTSIRKRVSKEKDFIIVLLLNLLGIGYFLVTRHSLLGKPLLVYAAIVLPATFYLISRRKYNWRKIIPATLVLGLIIGGTFDFIAEFTKTWTVIDFILPIKIFGIQPIDNILWYIMMTFYTLVFYEYFIDHERIHKISSHYKFLLILSIVAMIIMFSIFFISPSLLNIAYPYFTLGLAAISLPIIVGFLKPKLVSKMAITGAYFFFLYFIFEIIAVGYKYWVFNGNNYIGTVNFFGFIFPFEELFFWMMFYAPTLVAFYEVFVDDER